MQTGNTLIVVVLPSMQYSVHLAFCFTAAVVRSCLLIPVCVVEILHRRHSEQNVNTLISKYLQNEFNQFNIWKILYQNPFVEEKISITDSNVSVTSLTLELLKNTTLLLSFSSEFDP